MTTQETYRLFLESIRKGRTRSFPPDLFNPFINKVAREWLKGKVNEFQQNGKRIDDIDLLYVKTDGVDGYPAIEITSYINNVSVFDFPGIQSQLINKIPHAEIGGSLYPLSFRLIKVIANLNGKPVECQYLDSHKTLENKYQKLSENIVYYELSKKKIRIYATDRVPSIVLNYVRQPRPYFFDISTVNDHIAFEYGDEQVDEIIDNAVRVFLERNTDQRYKTFLNEEKIKSVNN